jgi:AraC-like DNA-binding protein
LTAGIITSVRGCAGDVSCLAELAPAQVLAPKGTARTPPACDFAESRVWDALGGGWHCLHGCYCQHGVSVEWHDFNCDKPRDWARSFHPGSVELCLNLSGHARLTCRKESVLLSARNIALYAPADQELSAWRLPGERHQFLTVEYSPSFLERHLTGQESALHPIARLVLRRRSETSRFSSPVRLSASHRKDIERLRHPPVAGPAAALWYQSKALEFMSQFFFAADQVRAPANGRQEQVSRLRVARAIEILSQRLSEPPALGELGRLVGCSPYHLSRTFSREMGMTIPQYLRQIRIERAAELLKSGKFNVTEAALEVGYSSLSHFSQVFCETMGCCPGLYPLGLTRSTGIKPPVADHPTSAIPRQ